MPAKISCSPDVAALRRNPGCSWHVISQRQIHCISPIPISFGQIHNFSANPISFGQIQFAFPRFQFTFRQSKLDLAKSMFTLGKSKLESAKSMFTLGKRQLDLADSTALFRNSNGKARFPIDLDAKPVCFCQPLSGKL